MDRTERIALLHSLLSKHRRGLSSVRLMEEVKCSRATLYRDLAFMRDALGAPLENEGDPLPSWRYVNRNLDAFQLPGVWLSPDELYAMMLAQHVLKQSGAGLLSQAIGPMDTRIQKILGDKADHLDRLRIKRTQARRCNTAVLRIVTEAVLGRRQLRFSYQARSSDHEKERLVSPQQLIHHRDNWYLDACEAGRTAVLCFALDRIRRPELTADAAIGIPVADLAADHESGYGIFAGPATATAVIRFTPHAARWIADEHWHPKQRQRLLPDGSLELTIPYANPRELLMDVTRYGKDAQVISPPELREQARLMHVEATAAYGEGPER
jgi:predicted DNA-binding transcriptional regulator YafY